MTSEAKKKKKNHTQEKFWSIFYEKLLVMMHVGDYFFKFIFNKIIISTRTR